MANSLRYSIRSSADFIAFSHMALLPQGFGISFFCFLAFLVVRSCVEWQTHRFTIVSIPELRAHDRTQTFAHVAGFPVRRIQLSAQDRSYGRSVVATQYGMVATSQVSASQAGALILERGGSAIDAAIAANAVLNVTEPTSNGMGGDLFAIYWEAKTGKIYGMNASGWAPKALTIEHLHAKGDHSHASVRYRFRHRSGCG